MIIIALFFLCSSLLGGQQPYTFSIPFKSLKYQEGTVLSEQPLPSLRDLIIKKIACAPARFPAMKELPSELQELIMRTWYEGKKERIQCISLLIPNIIEFRGHRRPITVVAGLDCGDVVTGSCDATIKVWDSGTGALKRTLEGHTAAITALYPVGNYLITASRDKTIRIWHVPRARPVAFRSVGADVTRLGDVLFHFMVHPEKRFLLVFQARIKNANLVFGWDGESIKKISTADFWDGLVPMPLLKDGSLIEIDQENPLIARLHKSGETERRLAIREDSHFTVDSMLELDRQLTVHAQELNNLLAEEKGVSKKASRCGCVLL